ncbi:MAG: TonB-dependent receptor [Parabacteroides sp.]|nr:TonB-dependent receptor [Parabacteroides sp.]
MQHVFLRRLLALWVLWLFSFITLYAQVVDTTKVHQLSGVEVVKKIRPSVSRESTPLQIMDKTGIERLGLQDLSEVVKRFSGVTVQDYGGIGGLKTVSVRSLGSKHTAVNYDGVTVTDAQNGQVDISRFSLDNVDMVSLSIGQSDDIFQTARVFASAGVLNIKSIRPVFSSRPFRIKAQVKTGSFGFVNPYLRYEQQLGKRWALNGQLDWQRADGCYSYSLKNEQTEETGKRKNSDIQSLRTELNLFGDLGKGGELSLKGYYYDSERGLPGSVILYNDYRKERLWDKNYFFQGYYKKQLSSRFSLQTQAKYNYAWNRYVDFNNSYASGEQEDLHTQREYYLSVGGLYTPIQNLSFSLNTDFFVNTLKNNLPNCPFPTRYSSLSVVAAQYKNSRITATASLLNTFITENVKEGNRPADRKRLSPGVSLSWRILEEQNLRVRASYKDIFRVPTFNDMYYLRIGNTNLKPEKTTQYNLGVTWSGEVSPLFSYLNVTVDGYYNRVKDKIIALPTLYVWKMMNFGEVSIGGIDANVSAEIFCNSSLSVLLQGNYTWQHAIDITDASAKNYKDQIPYTPRHAGSASVSLLNKWVNVSYLLTCAGDRYALPQNIEDNRIDAYVEQTISVNREFQLGDCRLRLQGEVLNIGNINYEIIKYYPMPGCSFRILVACSF